MTPRQFSSWTESKTSKDKARDCSPVSTSPRKSSTCGRHLKLAKNGEMDFLSESPGKTLAFLISWSSGLQNHRINFPLCWVTKCVTCCYSSPRKPAPDPSTLALISSLFPSQSPVQASAISVSCAFSWCPPMPACQTPLLHSDLLETSRALWLAFPVSVHPYVEPRLHQISLKDIWHWPWWELQACVCASHFIKLLHTHTLVTRHIEIKLLAKKLLPSWTAFTVPEDAL